jgi:LysR family transcriptional regulator, glycine cleavage system transcriptional activator
MGRKAKDEANLPDSDRARLARSLPPLNWLRSFEASARIASFTGAAEELALTQAAVSYQVRALERHLGFPLFERLPQGVRLTEMGKAYLPSIRKAFDEIAASTMGLFGADAGASLTVRAPISFGALWLAPRLESFCAAYPGIAIFLYSAIFNVALPAERVDLEIRVGDGDWPGFSAERFGSDPVIAVGRSRPGHRPRRMTLPELAGETLIEIMEVDDAWTRTFHAARLPAPPRRRTIRVDSSLMALELASAGVGYALILWSFARPYVEAGRLADVLGVSYLPPMSHYLLRPREQRHRKPETDLFVDWLHKEAREAGLLSQD